MRHLPILMFIVGLTAACASGENARSWVGKQVDDLIYSWGPPAALHELSDGRKSLKYSHSHMNNIYFCSAIFRSNTRGIIETVDIDGNIAGCNWLLGGKPSAPK